MFGSFLKLAGDVIGRADGPTSIMVSSGIRLGIILSIVGLFYLVGRILVALAVYFDARSKSNRDAVMWALLVGFLGLIPGIIYLCIRNTVRNYTVCGNCGISHLVTDQTCPQCGAPNPYSSQYVNPLADQQAHQAKVLLIIGLVILGVAIIAMVITLVNFLSTVISIAGSGYLFD